MSCCESFKLALSLVLSQQLPAKYMPAVINAVEFVAKKYTILSNESTKPTLLCDDVMRCFLTAKTVEEKSTGTIKTYRSFLSGFFDFINKDIAEITTSDIRSYLSNCKQVKQYKDNTMETVRRVLNGFFDFCQTEDLILKNPCKRIKPIKCAKSPRHAMKPIELEKIRFSCANLREKALVDFLYSTGCRVSELCRCKLSNIDWEKKTVLIEQGKGKVTRLTFLNPESEVSLRNYLASRDSESPYIFAKTHGKSVKPLVPETIQRLIKKISERANDVQTHVTPHVFRHTVATLALSNGMPVEQVQRFLGHANINTTLIYAEVNVDDVRRSHAKYVA